MSESMLDRTYCGSCSKLVVNIDAAVCVKFGGVCDGRTQVLRMAKKVEGTRPPLPNPGVFDYTYVDPYRDGI